MGSLRFRIIFYLLLFGLVSNLILSGVFVSSQYDRTLNSRVNSLTSYGQMLANSVASTGYLNDPTGSEAQLINTQISLIADIYDGRVVVVDRNCKIIEDSYNFEEGKTIIADRVIRGLRGESSTQVNETTHSAEIVIPVTGAAGSSEVYAVLIMSFNVEDIFTLSETTQNQSRLLVTIFALVMIIAAILISRHLTRPFRKIQSSIKSLADGYLQENVNTNGYTELIEVQEAINTMLRRLKVQEESRQQFVSDVSHELKTPITSIKVLSDSLLAQEDAPAEMYREFLMDISQEIDRESQIISDLLTLVRADRNTEELKIADTNINELIEQNLRRVRPIAEQRHIDLVYESFRDVRAQVDETKLSLAITNLIENAIKYNQDDGWVHVSLNADHQYFYLKVEDNGVGIPEEEQEHIFERFYRVDKARSRETGGTGLGLSITRSVIMMHKGNLKVYSRPGEGSTFTMRIPLYYRKSGGGRDE